MNAKRVLLFVLVLLVVSALAAVAAPKVAMVSDLPDAVQVPINAEIRSFLSDQGLDVSQIAEDGMMPAGLARELDMITRDDDTRKDLNALVGSAIRRSRMETGKPSFLRLGNNTWSYWLKGDEDIYSELDN
jgi:hypothetical protein